MKTPLLLLAVGLVATGVAAMAAQPDLTKLPPASSRKNLSYAKDVRPIFEASCFGCHGEQRQKGGLRLDSLEAVLKGGEDGKVITAGKSEKSVLVIAVARLDEEKAMPPMPKSGQGRGGPGGPGSGPGGPPPPGGRGGIGSPPKPLSAEQVGLIRAWVDQGAK